MVEPRLWLYAWRCSGVTHISNFAIIGWYHVPLLHKNATIINAQETLVILNFPTLYTTKDLELKHNVMIAYGLEPSIQHKNLISDRLLHIHLKWPWVQ